MKYQILIGDVLEMLATLPDESVQCVVTSPPYWGLRDYGVDGQVGLESTLSEYLEKMVAVFGEVRRVLRNDGVVWLNMGDSYASFRDGKHGKQSIAGSERSQPQSGAGNRLASSFRETSIKSKDLIGQPWRLAFALQADAWYLRSDIIWAKPNPMPESVTDRPTKSHEHIFLLTKSAKYYYDCDAVRQPNSPATKKRAQYNWCSENTKASNYQEMNGLNRNEEYPINPNGRNLRDVWTIPTQPYPEAHFATFPEEIPKRCILAGSKSGDTIFDPFSGSGTTGLVAVKLGRKYIGIELNPEYAEMSIRRIDKVARQELLL
jgi:DNA modification methylase